MRRIAVLAASVLAVVGIAGGCATLGRQAFAQPKVELTNVRVTGIGLNGGNLEVDIKLFNPNGYRLDVSKMTYKIAVDTIPVANGTAPRFTADAKDSVFERIGVAFTYAALGAAGRAILNTGLVNYHVEGSLTIATPVGSYTVPFSQTHKFSTTGGLVR